MSDEPDLADLKGQIADLQRRVARFSVVQQQLIDTRDRLDRALERFAGIQSYNTRAIAVRIPAVFATITAEAVVELFDLDFGLLWPTAPDGTPAAEPAAAVEIEPTAIALDRLHELLDSERFRRARTGLWGAADHPLVGALGLRQLVVSACVGPGETSFALAIGGVTAGADALHRGLGAEQLESFTVFAQQIGALLQNRRDQAIIEHQRELAEAANRAKSEFLSTVHHELLTPISAVLGFLEKLQGQGPATVPAQDLAEAHQSALRQIAMIKDILTWSEIEAGRLVPHTIPFHPGRALAAAAEQFREPFEAKGIDYRVEVSPGLPDTLLGDRLRLVQIVNNLVGNALKFTDTGSVRVAIGAAPLPAGRWELALTVQDTGIGIAPETLARLFTPFTQADGASNRRFGGTGLGLAICRRLLDLMGGRIWLESQPGAGTCFQVRLTLAATGAPSRRPAAASFPERILLVDDNVVGQRITGAMLGGLGLEVLVAGDGQQALDLFAQGGIGIVLMDIQMPVMDGLEATRRLRTLEGERSWPRTPVLALTANTMAADRDACMAAGMDDFIPRPVSKAGLKEALARWVAV